MRAIDLGLIVTLVLLLIAGAREWQHAEDETRVLRHRIEVLERITVSEHANYTAVIDWSTYK